MKINYHTHTYLCKHASGQIEDYVKNGIKNGLQVLGFSDHAPFYFVGDYVSGCRMEMDKIDYYFDTLLTLREKYKDYIDIKIGFEIEYYPRFWDKAIEKYRQYPLDYLILGNHFLGNESLEHRPITAPTTDKNALVQYVDECISAMKTDRITYLCHPDMMNYIGDTDIYNEEMSRLIASAQELNIPIELNMLGMRAKRHYPTDKFWTLAGKMGAKTVLGCDAHAPEHIALQSEIDAALRYADRFNVKILEDIELKNPIF